MPFRRAANAYPTFSWYCILTGMGIFPDAADLRPATAREARFNLAEIDNLLTRSTRNFRDHRQVLEAIPARRADESLQIYFW